MATWWDGLTEKQRRFVEAYASNGGNALAAAREAGYKNPHPEGARLLQSATIQAALERLRQVETDQAVATRTTRQAWWSSVMQDENASLRDRLRASELLGKSQGDFLDRVEHSGQIAVDLSVILDQIETQRTTAMTTRPVAPR